VRTTISGSAGDQDRRAADDRGDDVRDDDRRVAQRDAVRQPQDEPNEQHLLVTHRDAARRTVSADGADLQERRQRHRDTPGRCRGGEVVDHGGQRYLR
jgi:hypothetical protein